MPTVLRIGGLRVVIYTNDHRPAHVHVMGNGGEAAFKLHCPDGPPELREIYGYDRTQANAIALALAKELAALCADWRKWHGAY